MSDKMGSFYVSILEENKLLKKENEELKKRFDNLADQLEEFRDEMEQFGADGTLTDMIGLVRDGKWWNEE